MPVTAATATSAETTTATTIPLASLHHDVNTQTQQKPHRKRRSVTAAQDLTAGAVASSVSRFVIAPLDVLKIRFQIQDHRQRKYHSIRQAVRTIYTEEGLRAFWKGNLAAELMVVPYGAVSFLAYQQFKTTVDHLEILPHTPFWEHILCLSAGSFSGFASTIATYPLDLLRTRLAAQREPKVYRTLSAALVHIVSRDGPQGLYVGMWPTLVGIVPNMALQFGLYEGMKSTLARIRKLQKHPMQSAQVGVTDQFSCGFVAGVLAKLLTMPLDVIKKRYQVTGFHYAQDLPNHNNHNNSSQTSSPSPPSPSPPKEKPYRGVWDCGRQIVQHEGVRGLFKGSVPSLIKAGPNSALIFVVYEAALQIFDRLGWTTMH